jgi:GntR family transcriptional regulator
MRVAISDGDHRPIYAQIMDEVRRALVVGSLAPEDPLPSVREPAAELRVNPNTVAQAYRELAGGGVVYMRRGLGTFVSPDVRVDG